MLSNDFLIDKERKQTDIGAVKKRNGDQFEGIRLKQDFIRNAVFRQNGWEFLPLELASDQVPIGIHGVISGKLRNITSVGLLTWTDS